MLSFKTRVLKYLMRRYQII